MTEPKTDAWLGKEMMRQAELRLAAQATALAAMEARATSLLGVCAASVVALGAAAASTWPTSPAKAVAAAVVAISLFSAAIILMRAMRPRPGWGVPGIDPADMSGYEAFAQEECLKVMAGTLSQTLGANSPRLQMFGRALNIAAILMVAAPVFGAITLLLLHTRL